ncbi:MAG: hypothetical protein KDI31_16830, partial [Pseudomonadales bacterium]|nr:hypothetical protein [Pseudomonadales bacterium]
AKEVVVGTLDALYSPTPTASTESLTDLLRDAAASVPANLAALGDTLLDPLGIQVEDYQDLSEAATDQAVSVSTISALQRYFDGQLGAFSYLLFILLYMPCVATIGVIFKEIGGFWAVFSTSWSLMLAYSSAVICYQIGHLVSGSASSLPGGATGAIGWSLLMIVLAIGFFSVLVRVGRHKAPPLIPVLRLD